MTKPMSIARGNTRLDLSIERDAGNPILILMGGTKKDMKANWRKLKKLAEQALTEVDDLW